MEQRVYLAIDAKAFFASVECVARGLDPLTTNLVVADESRTEKKICLAVSPALKAYGISGRARLFEVVQKVKEVNALRRSRAPGRNLTGESFDTRELGSSLSLAVSYIVAPPRMARYVQCSATIYQTLYPPGMETVPETRRNHPGQPIYGSPRQLSYCVCVAFAGICPET